MTRAQFRRWQRRPTWSCWRPCLSVCFVARHWVLASFNDNAAQAQWTSFRDDVAQQSEVGSSVRRRVPKSLEPPALVLMRDYFATCTVIAVVLTSTLFATTAFFVGGVMIPSHAATPGPTDRK